MKNKLSPSVMKKMAKLAVEARDNAYAPYSDHPVGVALLSESGKIFIGANCEAAHYKGICGEGAAIAAMTTAGDRKIKVIMTVAPSSKYVCVPCGDCRQRIQEFSDQNTLIYAMYEDGTFGGIHTLQSLYPLPFTPEHMAVVGQGPLKNKNNKKKKKKK